MQVNSIAETMLGMLVKLTGSRSNTTLLCGYITCRKLGSFHFRRFHNLLLLQILPTYSTIYTLLVWLLLTGKLKIPFLYKQFDCFPYNSVFNTMQIKLHVPELQLSKHLDYLSSLPRWAMHNCVNYINTRILCVPAISEISGTGGFSTTLLTPTWRASLSELQQLLLKLTWRRPPGKGHLPPGKGHCPLPQDVLQA